MLRLKQKVIISPPVGTYINSKRALSVKGTFTWEQRPGKWRYGLRTVRKVKDGWVNKVGLRNEGIRNVELKRKRQNIYSIAAIEPREWLYLANFLENSEINLELNISCPNIKQTIFNVPRVSTIQKLSESNRNLIVKLPPTDQLFRLLDYFVGNGIKIVHVSNTLPVKEGGLSGKKLKKINISNIKKIKKKYKDIEIIAGGGIYSLEDALQYELAGANYFSLCTGWTNPWKMRQIINHYNPKRRLLIKNPG